MIVKKASGAVGSGDEFSAGNVNGTNPRRRNLGSVGGKELFKRFAFFRLNSRKSGSDLNFTCFLDELDKLFVLANSLLCIGGGWLWHGA